MTADSRSALAFPGERRRDDGPKAAFYFLLKKNKIVLKWSVVRGAVCGLHHRVVVGTTPCKPQRGKVVPRAGTALVPTIMDTPTRRTAHSGKNGEFESEGFANYDAQRLLGSDVENVGCISLNSLVFILQFDMGSTRVCGQFFSLVQKPC